MYVFVNWERGRYSKQMNTQVTCSGLYVPLRSLSDDFTKITLIACLSNCYITNYKLRMWQLLTNHLQPKNLYMVINVTSFRHSLARWSDSIEFRPI